MIQNQSCWLSFSRHLGGTHKNVILKMLCADLRFTTMIFLFPKHPFARKNRSQLVLPRVAVTLRPRLEFGP